MMSAQIIKMLVVISSNSPSQDNPHLDDQTTLSAIHYRLICGDCNFVTEGQQSQQVL